MNSTSVVQLTEPSPAREGDRICVFLHDCKTELRVGVYASEMHKPQKVTINIEVEAALPHRYQDLTEKCLDRVIDYEPIYNFIRQDLPQLGHVALLETVAEQIVAFCFRDVRIQKVSVRIEKTEVFVETSGAGIEISRARQNS
jgi:dihydroneopterin aldolase